MKSLQVFRHFIGRRPWVIAIVLVLLITLWLMGGLSQEAQSAEDTKDEIAAIIPKVQVEQRTTQPVVRDITLYGRTEPSRSVTLRAETHGRIIDIMAKRGARVAGGQSIVRLAMNDRQQKLAQAKALLKQRKIEFDGAKKLNTQGFSGKATLAQAEAQWVEAKADVVSLEQDIDYTLISAPFDGVLNDRFVEQGDYLGVGDQVAAIYDLDPLIVRADVTETDVADLQLGQVAHARFVGGHHLDGKVRYISKVANASTNTFKIEVAFDNPENKILAGLSVELDLPLKTVQAIKVSPALLALDAQGNLGIKSVVDNHVAFTPIDIVKSENDGVWLAGFSEQVQLITRGQGFVRVGDQVETVSRQAPSLSASAQSEASDE